MPCVPFGSFGVSPSRWIRGRSSARTRQGSRRRAAPLPLRVRSMSSHWDASRCSRRSAVTAVQERREASPVRLVFLATPGPGGGGGGGGLRQVKPPAKAELKGPVLQRSPVPPPRRITTRVPEPARKITPPAPPQPTPRPVEPAPPPAPTVSPEVVAPVAHGASGYSRPCWSLADPPAAADSQGSGTGSGAGTGQGTGVGEGTGAGIGPGSGGGTGGGPYRPGSGITAPGLLREGHALITLKKHVAVASKGTLCSSWSSVPMGASATSRCCAASGSGLDQRAADAVRQWRFSPARRFGTPVDVMVEVAVEFKLR